MKQTTFFLYLLLSFTTLSLTSCVKDEEDPEYTSYQTTMGDEAVNVDAKAANEVKNEQPLLADASQPTVEKEKPITLTPSKEQTREVDSKDTKTATTPVVKSEVPANERKREAAPAKVVLPPPVTNERGADKLIAKGAEGDATTQPRVVRGAGTATNKPTPVVAEPTLSQPVSLRGKTAVFSVDKSNYEFGFIDEGTKITHVYSIKNTGGTDLYINDVKPSCNCTVPDFSIESVPPGGSTTVKLVFDSNGKVGTQRKTATVMTNIGEYELTMTGTVRPKSKNY